MGVKAQGCRGKKGTSGCKGHKWEKREILGAKA